MRLYMYAHLTQNLITDDKRIGYSNLSDYFFKIITVMDIVFNDI